jgi:two-component system, OmpR family, sensor kinase
VEAVNAPVLALLLDPRVPIPAIVVRERAIAAANAAASELLDARPGQPIDALCDEESRGKLDDVLGAQPASCDLQAWSRGCEPVAVRVVGLPLGPGEHLLLVIGTGAEYSARMAEQLLAANDHLANLTRELSRQSAELEAARKRFESLAELRERFVSMLAHDVRGALQGIVLSAEAIERAADRGAPEQVRTSVGRVRRNAARIHELVETVLQAARTETGQVVLDPKPVALSTVVREVIEVYAPIADRDGVELAPLDRSGDAVVSGDRVRLQQIVGNLLENALRHSPAGSTVTLELSASPQTVRLAVSDQGPGIPAELRERVFERFVQGLGRSGSLGLGLHVAHQLAGLHHGSLHVEDVERGARLVLELPRRAPRVG